MTPAWAADITVKDGGTIQLAGTTYRLDGVDAPAFDQICLNEFADPYACGADALDHFTAIMRKHLGLHGFKNVRAAQIDLFWRWRRFS